MHFEKSPDMANGVFEHIPFREGEFDAVLCGYSLRDAIKFDELQFLKFIEY